MDISLHIRLYSMVLVFSDEDNVIEIWCYPDDNTITIMNWGEILDTRNIKLDASTAPLLITILLVKFPNNSEVEGLRYEMAKLNWIRHIGEEVRDD